jgi:hypothetical protein
MEEVKHYQINGKYRIQYERSAVKGQDGFKVEANGDDFNEVLNDADKLYQVAKCATSPVITV